MEIAMLRTLTLRSLWIKLSAHHNAVRGIGTFLALAVLSSASFAVELLTNPGFEGAQTNMPACPAAGWGGAIVNGVIAPGWSDNTCWHPSTTSITYSKDLTPTNLHTGAASQKMQVNSGQGVLVQSIPFLEAAYSGKVWLRAASPMNVTLQLRQASGGFYPYGQTTFSIPAADINVWKEYRVSGLAGATTGLLMVIVNSPGTLWIDDASVEKLDPPLPITATPAHYFGMHIHKNGLAGQNPSETLTNPWTLPAVGQPSGAAFVQRNPINAVRLWDARISWHHACPTASCTATNSWNWSSADAHIDRAVDNGVTEFTFTLGGLTPNWASVRKTECSPYGPGYASEPSNDQDWKDWVTAAGNHVKDKIPRQGFLLGNLE
jgi:hypothetical protein